MITVSLSSFHFHLCSVLLPFGARTDHAGKGERRKEKEENVGVSLVISDKITIFALKKVAIWPPFTQNTLKL
jgi:hypothetical protein